MMMADTNKGMNHAQGSSAMILQIRLQAGVAKPLTRDPFPHHNAAIAGEKAPGKRGRIGRADGGCPFPGARYFPQCPRHDEGYEHEGCDTSGFSGSY
jgi:hypothetical protein